MNGEGKRKLKGEVFPILVSDVGDGKLMVELDFIYCSSKDSSYRRRVTHGCGSTEHAAFLILSTEGCCLDKDVG